LIVFVVITFPNMKMIDKFCVNIVNCVNTIFLYCVLLCLIRKYEKIFQAPNTHLKTSSTIFFNDFQVKTSEM